MASGQRNYNRSEKNSASGGRSTVGLRKLDITAANKLQATVEFKKGTDELRETPACKDTYIFAPPENVTDTMDGKLSFPSVTSSTKVGNQQRHSATTDIPTPPSSAHHNGAFDYDTSSSSSTNSTFTSQTNSAQNSVVNNAAQNGPISLPQHPHNMNQTQSHSSRQTREQCSDAVLDMPVTSQSTTTTLQAPRNHFDLDNDLESQYQGQIQHKKTTICQQIWKWSTRCMAFIMFVLVVTLCLLTITYYRSLAGDGMQQYYGACVDCASVDPEYLDLFQRYDDSEMCCVESRHRLDEILQQSASSPHTEQHVHYIPSTSHDAANRTMADLFIRNDTNTCITLLQLVNPVSSSENEERIEGEDEKVNKSGTVDVRHDFQPLNRWRAGELGAKGNGYNYHLERPTAATAGDDSNDSKNDIITDIIIAKDGIYTINLHTTIMGFDHYLKPRRIFYKQKVTRSGLTSRATEEILIEDLSVVECVEGASVSSGCGTAESERSVHLRQGDVISMSSTHRDLLLASKSWFSIIRIDKI